MTTYDEIAGAHTIEPAARHLTSDIDGFFDGLLEQHPWSRGVGLEPPVQDRAWKPALGSILEMQALSKRAGGLGLSIEGVTSAYIYMRRAGAFFPAHTENSDLFSVNVLLPGAWAGVTIWYSVPAADFMRFKSLASTFFMKEFAANSEFLRAKSVLIEPAVLRRNGVRCVRTVQRPGEGVITLPGAVHFGFSTGVNMAVAWNVGTPTWVPYGLDSKPYTGVYTYAHIEVFELCKLAVLKRCGRDVEKAQIEWDATHDDLVYYRDGFDPIYPQARPSRSQLNQVVPAKYVLLGGRWFVSIGLTKDRRGLRYQCCCRECRVNTTLMLETVQYTDVEPCHRDGDHSFEPDVRLIGLPFNLI